MAALMLQVPPDVARVLGEIPAPGKTESTDKFHITVVHLGDDVPVEDIGAMLPALHRVTSKIAPFMVETDWVTTFPAGKNGVPVIARVESAALHALRDALCSALDEDGVEYDKKFPEYKPHVTLSYDPNKDVELDLEIPSIQWGVTELTLWGANRGVGELTVRFPLSFPETKVAGNFRSMAPFYRALIQLAKWEESSPTL